MEISSHLCIPQYAEKKEVVYRKCTKWKTEDITARQCFSKIVKGTHLIGRIVFFILERLTQCDDKVSKLRRKMEQRGMHGKTEKIRNT